MKKEKMTESFLKAMSVLGNVGSVVRNTSWNNQRKLETIEVLLPNGRKEKIIFLISENEYVQWSISSVDANSNDWIIIKGEPSNNLPSMLYYRKNKNKIINNKYWGNTFLNSNNLINDKFSYRLTIPDIIRDGFEFENDL